jgi:hypothetical protein
VGRIPDTFGLRPKGHFLLGNLPAGYLHYSRCHIHLRIFAGLQSQRTHIVRTVRTDKLERFG